MRSATELKMFPEYKEGAQVDLQPTQHLPPHGGKDLEWKQERESE